METNVTTPLPTDIQEATDVLAEWTKAYDLAVKDASLFGIGLIKVNPEGNMYHLTQDELLNFINELIVRNNEQSQPFRTVEAELV